MRGARAILCPAWQWVDVTAADPGLLVHLKSLRNTVPVPKHWGQKRKYLQNKRGLEKLPFVLPGASTTPLSRADSRAIAGDLTLTGGVRAYSRVLVLSQSSSGALGSPRCARPSGKRRTA